MLIGICGKSGSGKSTISNTIKDYYDNVIIIDIDKIGHESYENPDIMKKMISFFGPQIITNGKVDRKKLSAIVFNSKEEMKRLEEVTWEYMEQRIDNIINSNKDKIIILDWQLLPLTKFFKMCDYKILLDIPYEIRRERIIKRDKITEEKFIERENAAIVYNPDDFDFIIKNNKILNIRRLVKKYDESFISWKF